MEGAKPLFPLPFWTVALQKVAHLFAYLTNKPYLCRAIPNEQDVHGLLAQLVRATDS